MIKKSVKNMCAERRNLKWTLMLLFLGGIFCSTYNATYHQQHICAVKGSTVEFVCLFYYPDKEKVESVKWGHERHHIYDGPFIYDSELNRSSSRFEYIGNKNHNCSFKIHKVDYNDTGEYHFRFITDSQHGKWTQKPGSTLKIVDLNMNVTKTNEKETMKEGDSVNLTCINSCDGGKLSSEFIWFKNGESIFEGPVLDLRNMSFTNSGNYTCSLKTHTGTTSGVNHIDVEYGPKNTSVSVKPSEEVDAGSNVTLICSSHANPPVENYTWFKIYANNTMAVGHQHCFEEVFQSDDGQYFCRAANKHGSQNSSVMTIRIKVYWATFTRDVLIIAASAAVILLVTTLVAIKRLSKKGTVSLQTDCEVDVQSTDYVNWSMCDMSKSQEGNQCYGEPVYATVNFNTKRKSDASQQMDSHSDDECVVYTTVGRNQLLNSAD